MRLSLAPRTDKRQVEEGLAPALKFDSQGLIPVVAQDASSGEVLMLAYMNHEALEATLERGEAVYWSRSRQELWHKGATSGQIQKVVELRVDCDQDALLMRVVQLGGACCHTGRSRCFYRALTPEGGLVHDEGTDD